MNSHYCTPAWKYCPYCGQLLNSYWQQYTGYANPTYYTPTAGAGVTFGQANNNPLTSCSHNAK